VVREQLGLAFDDSRKPPLEQVRDASVQLLASRLEQRLIGSVLNQGVLEAIVGLRTRALGNEEIRFGEPVERGVEGRVFKPADSAEQRIGEISP